MIHTMLSPEVIASLPTPRGVALTLSAECRKENAHLQHIASLVRMDPALSGRLLSLANSAAAGGGHVVSIDDAVSKMGLVLVSQIALAFSLIDQHAAGLCSNFNYAGFWNQSLLMASAAKEFGVPRKLGQAGELFTVGLLAQVGQLALATAYADEYSELIAQELSPAELSQREKAIAGVDHLELSVALMEHWGIPSDYAVPFGFHEAPTLDSEGPDARRTDRYRLAHTSWRVGKVLAHEGIDAVLKNPLCLESMGWLQLRTEALMEHLTEIESVWRLWLTLISRNK